MSIGTKFKHKLQAFTGGIKERYGHTTGNGRLKREGRSDRVKGNLKQSGDKARDAFKH
ncbi:CsbD family protein [Streptomyces sp. RKAG337]|uniref:CsbD family protein n=1 Tax=Streptomyces sp. RKAG337 TaxID=2893404 RepID=UPI0020348FC1|nr:CsbD family protein [Streptomyces sp. RKAG337]MCM2425105.1 CsbD family protein [Streptomyces sp. RKAG337]